MIPLEFPLKNINTFYSLLPPRVVNCLVTNTVLPYNNLHFPKQTAYPSFLTLATSAPEPVLDTE